MSADTRYMLLLHDSQSAADTNLCHVQSGHVNDKKASPQSDRDLILTTGSTQRENITGAGR